MLLVTAYDLLEDRIVTLGSRDSGPVMLIVRGGKWGSSWVTTLANNGLLCSGVEEAADE